MKTEEVKKFVMASLKAKYGNKIIFTDIMNEVIDLTIWKTTIDIMKNKENEVK